MSYNWTDDPLTTDTPIKKQHIDELRENLNNERQRRNMSTLSWTDDPLTTDTPVKTIHIEELRQGIDETPVDYSGCSTNDSVIHSAEYFNNNESAFLGRNDTDYYEYAVSAVHDQYSNEYSTRFSSVLDSNHNTQRFTFFNIVYNPKNI